ncbi:hypothetical protein HDV00_004366 [Rhizophlyctis rosea]|nr:hypothetical protein HDV00_004366 [Rhizophlyctis rosea]
MSNIITPPDAYGIIEPGIHRSNLLHPPHFPFIQILKLRTIVVLSPDMPSKHLAAFSEEGGVKLIHLGQHFTPPNLGWRPVSEERIKEVLELILNVENHPVLVMDTPDGHDIGVLVGCLRKLQSWNFNTIVTEYRSFAGSKSRSINEQFIELFDTDLITLPRALPDWFVEHRRLLQLEEEQNDITQTPLLQKRKDSLQTNTILETSYTSPREMSYENVQEVARTSVSGVA